MSEDFSRPELPAPDFDFLIYSLRLQAEMSLGILPLGDDDVQEPDYELARHHIDLLAMLQVKTKGNLTAEEQQTLDHSLSELRVRFVEAQEELPAR
jgi:uncharacterized protein DUF1844